MPKIIAVGAVVVGPACRLSRRSEANARMMRRRGRIMRPPTSAPPGVRPSGCKGGSGGAGPAASAYFTRV